MGPGVAASGGEHVGTSGEVRCVLFDVPLRPGSLTLVEMGDGSLRVMMNDAAVEGCHWEGNKVGEAVRGFMEVKEALRRGRGVGVAN